MDALISESSRSEIDVGTCESTSGFEFSVSTLHRGPCERYSECFGGTQNLKRSKNGGGVLCTGATRRRGS